MAIYADSTENLSLALNDGARHDLSINGNPSGFEGADGKREFTLCESVIINNIERNDDSNSVSGRLVLELHNRGIDVIPFIRELADPRKIIGNYAESILFLEFIIERWEHIFGDKDGWKSKYDIHEVVQRQDHDRVNVLIKYGIPIDSRDDKGMTPLMWARRSGIIHSLKKQGADLFAVDNQGKTPLWYMTKRVLENIKKKNGEDSTIEYQDVHGLSEMAGTNGLAEDPHGITIANKLGRRIDLGLKAILFGGEAPDAFNTLLPQINMLRSKDRRNRLEKIVIQGCQKEKIPVLKTKPTF